MLRFNQNFPISPTNTPRIVIHDCCTNLIDACENYGILPQRDPTKGEPEKRSEEYKDFIDAMRYGVLYPPPPFGTGALDLYTDEDWRRENDDWGTSDPGAARRRWL